MTAVADEMTEGVRWRPIDAAPERVAAAAERERVMLATGVTFGPRVVERVPWLMAERPFPVPATLRARLVRVGSAIFALIDAAQSLYMKGDAATRALLDIGVAPHLRGLDSDGRVETFRLDLVLMGGEPRVTEVEEVYGNAGKLHAMQQAYGTDCDALFQRFAALDVDTIFVDDGVTGYGSELRLLCDRLRAWHGQDVRVENFSRFREGIARRAWRFCYTKDFVQYAGDHVARIVAGDCAFVNPLFHGYGTKALLALPFEPHVTLQLASLLGQSALEELRRSIAACRVLPHAPSASDVRTLVASNTRAVLKVLDCPGGAQYTWGSRGVFFGHGSRSRWERTVEAAAAGRVPGDDRYAGVRYLVSDVIESDRFDVPYWDAASGSLRLMPDARIRLGPIFFRDAHGRVHLTAGHATFVNTSRKVHLGHHAVCGPMDFRADGDSE